MCIICWWVLLLLDQKAGWSKAGHGSEGKLGSERSKAVDTRQARGSKAHSLICHGSVAARGMAW